MDPLYQARAIAILDAIKTSEQVAPGDPEKTRPSPKIDWKKGYEKLSAPDADSMILGLACYANDVEVARTVLKRRPALVNLPVILPTKIFQTPETDPMDPTPDGEVQPTWTALSLSLSIEAHDVRDLLLSHPAIDVNALGSIETNPEMTLTLPLNQALYSLTRQARNPRIARDYSTVDRILAKGANPFLSASGNANEAPFYDILDRLTRKTGTIKDGGREDTSMVRFYIQIMNRFLKAIPALGLSPLDPCLEPAKRDNDPGMPLLSDRKMRRNFLLNYYQQNPDGAVAREFAEARDPDFDPAGRLEKLSNLHLEEALSQDANLIKESLRNVSGLDFDTYSELLAGWLKKAGYGRHFFGQFPEQEPDAQPDTPEADTPEADTAPLSKPTFLPDASALHVFSDEEIGNLLQNCQSELLERLKKRKTDGMAETNVSKPTHPTL